MSDSLGPEKAEPLLTGRFGRPYTYLESCQSTQLLLDEDVPEGAVAVCDHQVAGRGRHGRDWLAPPGVALLCSIALRPSAERHVPELTLVGTVAAVRAIEDATDLAAQIKWPNDVMLNRRKVCGVLGELRDGMVVLGIGVNVNQTPGELPTDARVAPGSLRSITGTTYDRAALLGSLLAHLEQAYDVWCDGELAAIYEEIGPRDFLRGRAVTVDGRAGVAVAITRSGALEVDAGRGEIIVVTSGEVEYER